MAKKSKNYDEVMKEYFNKELAMTKKNNEDFESSTKYWNWNMDFFIMVLM